jgi:hypothetical protein
VVRLPCAASGEIALHQKLQTQIQAAGVVHGEHLNRCASGGRYSFDPHTAYLKVVIPLIPTRVEEWNYLIRRRIDAGKIRPFPQVAAVASQSQVFRFVGPSVLPRGDVLNVVGKMAVVLSKQAVLAAISGPLAD